MGNGIVDPRFAAAQTDPRFQRFPKAERKVDIDERFGGKILAMYCPCTKKLLSGTQIKLAFCMSSPCLRVQHPTELGFVDGHLSSRHCKAFLGVFHIIPLYISMTILTPVNLTASLIISVLKSRGIADMFKDKAFQVRSTVDKRGRKIGKKKQKEDMRKYYRLPGTEVTSHLATCCRALS